MPLALPLFVVATGCALVVRVVAPGLPSDVRLRALAAAALTVGLVVVEGVAPHALARLPTAAPSAAMLVMVLVAGLAWRIPERMQSWATLLGEVAMLLTTVVSVRLDGPVASTGVAVATGLCIVWAGLGTVLGRAAAAASSPREVAPTLVLGVIAAAVALHAPSPSLAAVVAATAMTMALALERPPAAPALGRRLGRAALGAGAAVLGPWIVGLPLDARALLPALVGVLLVDTAHRSRPAASPAAHHVLEPLDVERETLAVLGRLASPLADPSEPLMLSLEHVFPGARIELLRNPEAPAASPGPGQRIHPELLAEVCRRGLLVHRADGADDVHDTLPRAAALALRRLGPSILLLPVTYEARIHGALLVRGGQRREGMLAQARRFADLLGHRLEAQRLFAELQHKQRLATLGTFAAALIHDLRSPLSTVRLDMQLLQRTSSAYEREALADAIQALDRVIDDLSGTLDFTRPLELDIATLDLAALATEVVSSQQAQAERKGVVLREPASPREPARVRGDRPRLLRVLENLLRNALEVSTAGTTVAVSIVVTADEVELAVKDQGPGIDPSLGERVFEPFVTTKREGVGLGLAIVRKIVEAHHGRVALASTTDAGTCVSVWLPRVRGADHNGPPRSVGPS